MGFKRSTQIGKEGTGFESEAKATNTPIYIAQALKLVDGRLTAASGTDVPEFIAQSSSPATEAEARIYVERITELDEYETTLSVDGTSLLPGDKVTIADGGRQVTATTGGTFTLTTAGGPEGTPVRGMFRR